jgi:hypothetical protein
MNISNKNAPNKACVFAQDDAFSFSSTEEEKKLHILGYSGGVIPNHWYWGNLVIDLAGMSFPKEKYPILVDHDTDRHLGFSETPDISLNKLEVVGTLLKNAEGEKFLQDAEAGYPFQASIRVRPHRVQRLDEDETVDVNGFTFTGPGSVIRACDYMEVSCCTFGYDSNTSTAVGFADDGVSVSFEEYGTVKEQTMPFDVEKFKLESPEDFAAVKESIVAEFSAEKDSRISELELSLTEKDSEIEQLKQSESAALARVSELESSMKESFAAAQDAKFSQMVSDAVSGSDLPEGLREKFSKLVDKSAFLGEDGALDEVALSNHLSAELAEWMEAMPKSNPTVIGGGSSAGKDASAQFTDDAAELEALRKTLNLTTNS